LNNWNDISSIDKLLIFTKHNTELFKKCSKECEGYQRWMSMGPRRGGVLCVCTVVTNPSCLVSRKQRETGKTRACWLNIHWTSHDQSRLADVRRP
jgi:hypothetical protein